MDDLYNFLLGFAYCIVLQKQTFSEYRFEMFHRFLCGAFYKFKSLKKVRQNYFSMHFGVCNVLFDSEFNLFLEH